MLVFGVILIVVGLILVLFNGSSPAPLGLLGGIALVIGAVLVLIPLLR